MNEEMNKCSFCKAIKPVLRRYVHAGNPNLDDNKQATSVIIYYCNDCGIED